jgi:tripartite ATP-independent transporter DctP family solute receptor
MGNLKKTLLSFISLALLAAAPVEAAFKLKAGHTLAPDHPYQLGLQRLADLLKERTHGEITMDAFHSSSLGSERELIEAVQMGTVDLTIVSTAPLSGFTKAFLVYDLPFIFPDSATAHRVLDGPFGQKTLDSVTKNGMVGLAFFENGFRHVTNSRSPVIHPADAKGLKIRTMENKIHMASFRTVGAQPMPMAFGELFTALQQKTIDAEENPIPIIWTSKFYEVQKYCSLTGHFYAPTPVLINQGLWKKFSPEQQKIFQQSVLDARDYERELIAKQNSEFIDQLKAKGMEIAEVDKAEWQNAMLSVYKEYEKEIGADTIATIQAEIARK